MLLFVGLDPGTTLGYAVLDLNGKLIAYGSSKEIAAGDLIRKISDIGKVIVVATDKSKVPYLVRTVATKLGAVVYAPKEDTPVIEKIQVTRDIQTKSSHERDSIAMARMAFSSYQKRLKDIELFLKINDSLDIQEEFIQQFIRHPNLGYSNILEKIRNIDEDNIVDIGKEKSAYEKNEKNSISISPQSSSESNLKNVIKNQNREINSIRQENNRLKSIAKKLEESKDFLSSKLKPNAGKSEKELMQIIAFKEQRLISFSKKISQLSSENSSLNSRISKLLSLMSDESNMIVDFIPSLKELSKLSLIQNKVIFIDNLSFFSQKEASALGNLNITVISRSVPSTNLRKSINANFILWNKPIEVFANKAIISKKFLSEKLASSRKFETIISEYREERRSQLTD